MTKAVFNNLGMVIARGENLFRIEAYGLRRAEFVVFDPTQREVLNEYLDSHDVHFSIHTPLFVPLYYPENPLLASIVDCDEDRRKLAVGLMLDNIDLAAEMGAEFVVAHIQRPERFGGCAPEAFGERGAMDAAFRSAEMLMEKSRATGVPVVIENIMDNTYFFRGEQYLELLEKFPGLEFCMDVGHLDYDARRFGLDFHEFVRELVPYIREVHLQNATSDVNSTASRPWKIPVHPSQTPDDGWCDIDTVLRDVLAARPDCVINFEFRAEKHQGNDFILEGMNWVRGIISSVHEE